MKIKIVILTGGELRHDFVRKYIANSEDIDVLATYCEGAEKSLKILVEKDVNPDELRLKHLQAREQSEQDFFDLYCQIAPDNSNPIEIAKGAINLQTHVDDIIALNPDLIIAYGCSIVKGDLLSHFEGRFLNVHLGLSPYYRGSGTNFWPLVNGEFEFVGATFMYIDAGVDTGEVIHQIRAKMTFADSPSQIGNRLIVEIAKEYIKVIRSFSQLKNMPTSIFNEAYEPRYYRKKDFDESSVELLYQRFNSDMVSQYLSEIQERHSNAPIAVNPSVK